MVSIEFNVKFRCDLKMVRLYNEKCIDWRWIKIEKLKLFPFCLPCDCEWVLWYVKNRCFHFLSEFLMTGFCLVSRLYDIILNSNDKYFIFSPTVLMVLVLALEHHRTLSASCVMKLDIGLTLCHFFRISMQIWRSRYILIILCTQYYDMIVFPSKALHQKYVNQISTKKPESLLRNSPRPITSVMVNKNIFNYCAKYDDI